MAILTGNYGQIVLDAASICEITEWTVTIETARPDVTGIASLNEERGRGLTKGYGSFVSLDQITAMQEYYDIVATFSTSQDSGDSVDISGNIQTTKQSPRVSVDGLITWTYEFVFNGEITIA